MHFTQKERPLKRADLDDFVSCLNPENRRRRKCTWSEENPEGRWRVYEYEELIKRDKASLDIFWLKDKSLEDGDDLPEPDVLAQEIADDLQTALEQFATIGLTNLEAAQAGYAPGRIDPTTGSWDDVVLHHMLDDPRGDVIQAWRSDHSAYHQMIARDSNYWRELNPAWAEAWRREVPAYWKWRTGAYNPPMQTILRLPGDI
jgi:hypothetical protein